MQRSTDCVLVVILNFNGWQETLACLESVISQNFKDFNVMLIDNGSADESLKHLSKFEKHEKITLIKQPVNLGFAGGVNLGINHAIKNNYKYTALLNNDATLDKNWLEVLVQTIKKTDSSSATGLLLDSSGKIIESTGDGCSSWGLPYPRQRGENINDAYDSGYVFGGTAGATVYKTALFEDIGLFDEKFFAYYEDTDISFRSQIAGHKAYYEKSARGYHDHGTTSSKIPGFTVYQTFKNLPVFFWKNVPLSMLPSTGVRFFSCLSYMYIRAIFRGQFIVATKGLFRSLTLFPYALVQRRHIQQNRRVPMSYLKTVIHQGPPPNTTVLQSLRRRLGIGS